MQVRVQGSGFRVRGSGFKVQGAGCRVQGAGFRIQGSGFRVQGSGFRVQGSGFRVQGLGLIDTRMTSPLPGNREICNRIIPKPDKGWKIHYTGLRQGVEC